MNRLADAFIALPGGVGTLEELMEVIFIFAQLTLQMITWLKLGIHRKPIGICNTDQFYSPLLAQLNVCYDMGFIKESPSESVIVDTDVERLVDRVVSTIPKAGVAKWDLEDS